MSGMEVSCREQTAVADRRSRTRSIGSLDTISSGEAPRARAARFFSFSKDVPKGRGKTGSEYLGTACKTNNLGMDANVRGKKGGTAAPRPCTLLRPRDLQRKNRKVLG